MRTSLTLLGCFLFTTFGDKLSADGAGCAIQGTWELSAQKVGKGQMVDRTKTNVREIKLIVDGHFVWTIYKTKNGNLDSAGGGTYTLTGDTYVEHLDFGSPRLGRAIDQNQKFNVKLEGDRLVQTGVLSDGTELQEVWQRMPLK